VTTAAVAAAAAVSVVSKYPGLVDLQGEALISQEDMPEVSGGQHAWQTLCGGFGRVQTLILLATPHRQRSILQQQLHIMQLV
jgi:hypothetical protein